MELDRQGIERRDFPIGRRGYDPAAVDAHLRTLASEVEELQRSAGSRVGESLGSAAGTRVQSILEAAETTAANIERQAAEDARRTRAEADHDAEVTRADAVRRAQEHVAAVAQATATLLERVESMDGEVSAIVQSLRAGAGRLSADLTSVQTRMGELYDAASGKAPGRGATQVLERPAVIDAAPTAPAPTPSPGGGPDPTGPSTLELGSPDAAPVQNASVPMAAAPAGFAEPAPVALPGVPDGNLDGARLIALNMALNGEPREQADLYLAENFALSDRAKLLDEVYAAIEG